MRRNTGQTAATIFGLLLISGVLALLIQLMPKGGPLSYPPGQPKTPQNLASSQTQTSGNPPNQSVSQGTIEEVIRTLADQIERNKQETYSEQLLKNLATDPIVWLTIALTYLATVQLKVYQAEVKDTRSIERGYLDVAHVEFGLYPQPDGRHLLKLEIKNRGNTPVAVDRGFVRIVNDLAVAGHWFVPEGADSPIPGGFLVPDKWYQVPVFYRLTPEQITQINAGTLYAVAWVEYADVFSSRHRVGYARRFHVMEAEDGARLVALVWDAASARHNHDTPIDKTGQPRQ